MANKPDQAQMALISEETIMLTLFWKSNLAFVRLTVFFLLELSCDIVDGDYFIWSLTAGWKVHDPRAGPHLTQNTS